MRRQTNLLLAIFFLSIIFFVIPIHGVEGLEKTSAQISKNIATDEGHHHTHKHTVSGFSSGADMALTHFVAFSRTVTGVGIVGGAPYGCQILADAGDACGAMSDNASLPWEKYVDDEFFPYLVQRAEDGFIDDLEHMRGANVYLYSGKFDTCVYKPVMKAVERQLRNLTKTWDNLEPNLGKHPDFHTVWDIPSEHAWIVDDFVCSSPGHNFTHPYYCGPKESEIEVTTGTFEYTSIITDRKLNNVSPEFLISGEQDSNYHNQKQASTFESTHGCCAVCDAGGNCNGRNPPHNVSGPWWRPPINQCGYDMSGEMFKTVIGSGNSLPHERSSGNHKHLFKFNQSRYSQNGTDQSAKNTAMSTEAFIYIPEECHHHKKN